MTTRKPVAHYGGASNPSQPNGIYLGIIEIKYSNTKASVKIPAFGNLVIGPCRAVSGLTLSKGQQVLCAYINGQLDEMVITATLG